MSAYKQYSEEDLAAAVKLYSDSLNSDNPLTVKEVSKKFPQIPETTLKNRCRPIKIENVNPNPPTNIKGYQEMTNTNAQISSIEQQIQSLYTEHSQLPNVIDQQCLIGDFQYLKRILDDGRINKNVFQYSEVSNALQDVCLNRSFVIIKNISKNIMDSYPNSAAISVYEQKESPSMVFDGVAHFKLLDPIDQKINNIDYSKTSIPQKIHHQTLYIFNQKKMISSGHIDCEYGWVLLKSGKKVWISFPPYSETLKVGTTWNLKQIHETVGVKWIIQNEGDLIITAPGTKHIVLSITECVAYSTFINNVSFNVDTIICWDEIREIGSTFALSMFSEHGIDLSKTEEYIKLTTEAVEKGVNENDKQRIKAILQKHAGLYRF